VIAVRRDDVWLHVLGQHNLTTIPSSDTNAQVADAQYALHKKHGTHPVLTMAVPFITNIPILLITSLAIRNAIQMPDTALVGQSLLWIKDITEPDPHGAMGMIAGCMAFASSEIHNVRRRRFEKIAAEEAAPSVPAEVDALETPATAAATPTPTAPSAPARTAAKPKLPQRPFSTSATARAAPPTRKRKPASAPVSAVPRQGQQSARRMPGVVQVVDGKRTIVPLSKLLEEENAIGGGADAAKEAAGAFQRGLERVGKLWSIGIIGLSLVQPAVSTGPEELYLCVKCSCQADTTAATELLPPLSPPLNTH